jgi:ATP-dependent 26S proteasome regulatory subunit
MAPRRPKVNNGSIALISAIDQYHDNGSARAGTATNRFDGLDDTLLAEGRLDLNFAQTVPMAEAGGNSGQSPSQEALLAI